MFLEVENFEDFEDHGELVVECDEEFAEFAKKRTGIEETDKAVEEMVNSILREEIEERKEEE